MHDDYHGHPNYFLTWLGLVALFLLSLAGVYLDKRLALLLIFGVAAIKAGMVLANFMHLRFEPRLLWGIVGFGVLCAGCFFAGVYVDIVPVHLEIAK